MVEAREPACGIEAVSEATRSVIDVLRSRTARPLRDRGGAGGRQSDSGWLFDAVVDQVAVSLKIDDDWSLAGSTGLAINVCMAFKIWLSRLEEHHLWRMSIVARRRPPPSCRGATMQNHRSTQQQTVPKNEEAHNFRPGDALETQHTRLVQLEVFAHLAGEVVTRLSPPASREQRREYIRLYALVAKVAEDAIAAVHHGDALIARLAASVKGAGSPCARGRNGALAEGRMDASGPSAALRGWPAHRKRNWCGSRIGDQRRCL